MPDFKPSVPDYQRVPKERRIFQRGLVLCGAFIGVLIAILARGPILSLISTTTKPSQPLLLKLPSLSLKIEDIRFHDKAC